MMRLMLEVVMVLAVVLGVLYVMTEMEKERKADKALRNNEDSADNLSDGEK